MAKFIVRNIIVFITRVILMSNNNICQTIEIKPGNIEKRPEITSETTPIEYFEELMFARVNLCSLSKIDSLNTIIRFDIDGDNAGSWTIEVEGGLLKRVIRNYTDTSLQSSEAVLEPSSTFLMDSETLMSIIRREITPQQAFFSKMVQIEGDITIALKMNVLVNYL
ncbi:MAG: SCP2 sterol-binding domain-containing protein [Thermodesulfobacteriota bacterium]